MRSNVFIVFFSAPLNLNLFAFRKVHTVDSVEFSASLERPDVHVQPLHDVDSSTRQLEQSVTDISVNLAPPNTCTKLALSKACCRWLSHGQGISHREYWNGQDPTLIASSTVRRVAQLMPQTTYHDHYPTKNACPWPLVTRRRCGTCLRICYITTSARMTSAL